MIDVSSLLRKDGKVNNRILGNQNPVVVQLIGCYPEECRKYGVSGVVNVIIHNQSSFDCRDCGNPLDKIRYKLDFVCNSCVFKKRSVDARKTVSSKYGVENSFDVLSTKKMTDLPSVDSMTKEEIQKEVCDLYLAKCKKRMKQKIFSESYAQIERIKELAEKIFPDRVDLSLVDKFKLIAFNNSSDMCSYCGENKIEKLTVAHMSRCRECSVLKANEKRTLTSLAKYGKTHHTKTKEYTMSITGMNPELAEIYDDPSKVYDVYVNECGKNLANLSEYFGVAGMGDYFNRHGLIVEKGHTVSKGEKEIVEYIKSLGVDVIENDRSLIGPKEVDILIPSHNIAIEFSGVYWHSELYRPKNYHYDKWKLCGDKGVKLLTFWDEEYYERKTQILNFIKSNLGIYDKSIYARKCIFKELNFKPNDFFEENHIQGKSMVDRAFGLYYNEELVGAVSYAKHHRNSGKYTLNRLAFKAGIRVVGGVGKLVRKSLNIIGGEVVTWSDNRYSTGEIYTKNLFKFDSDLRPDYFYYDNKHKRIRSKQSQQKKSIGCPPDITERDFCLSLDRHRIWDCGKKRFIFNKGES